MSLSSQQTIRADAFASTGEEANEKEMFTLSKRHGLTSLMAHMFEEELSEVIENEDFEDY